MRRADEDLQHDDTDLGLLVGHLARRLRRHRRKSLEPFGLAAHQARAFLTIARADGHDHELRISRLADRLGIAPRSATEVVDALEDLQLVRREPSPTDRRATQLLLTDDGRHLRHRLDAARADRSDEFFDCLSTAEQSELRQLLAKVAAATDDGPHAAR